MWICNDAKFLKIIRVSDLGFVFVRKTNTHETKPHLRARDDDDYRAIERAFLSLLQIDNDDDDDGRTDGRTDGRHYFKDREREREKT